eukprot:755336-Hanusia_phi.AAC.1
MASALLVLSCFVVLSTIALSFSIVFTLFAHFVSSTSSILPYLSLALLVSNVPVLSPSSPLPTLLPARMPPLLQAFPPTSHS